MLCFWAFLPGCPSWRLTTDSTIFWICRGKTAALQKILVDLRPGKTFVLLIRGSKYLVTSPHDHFTPSHFAPTTSQFAPLSESLRSIEKLLRSIQQLLCSWYFDCASLIDGRSNFKHCTLWSNEYEEKTFLLTSSYLQDLKLKATEILA